MILSDQSFVGRRAGSVVRILLWSTLPAIVILFTRAIIFDTRWWISGGCAFSWLIALYFYKSQQYSKAFLCLISAIVIGVSAAALLAGGIRAPGMVVFVGLPMWFLYMYGIKAGWVSWLVCSVMILIIYFCGVSGLLPITTLAPERLDINRMVLLVTISAAVVGTGVAFSRLINQEHTMVLKSNQELKDAMIELNLQQATLLQQAEERQVILSMLTHDLSSPLAVSMVSLDMLRRSNLEAETVVLVERVSAGMDNARVMLERAQTFVTAQSGKLNFKKEKCSCDEVFSAVSLLVTEFAQKKEVALVWSKTDLQLVADPFFLKNILFNLLTNAIKFSEAGDTVQLLAEKGSDNSIYIYVTDEGSGIPEEMIPGLFRLDVNTNRAGTEGEKGSGLGLPLVKFYTERMDGTITLTSVEKQEDRANSGTCVTLKFPARA
ncbi:MAG: sensor histidine kinase [Bacteriovoracia bacterium]